MLADRTRRKFGFAGRLAGCTAGCHNQADSIAAEVRRIHPVGGKGLRIEPDSLVELRSPDQVQASRIGPGNIAGRTGCRGRTL